jgi:hypothetical protein
VRGTPAKTIPRLFVQRLDADEMVFICGRKCAQETASKAANRTGENLAADGFIWFAKMLPDSTRTSHVKNAERLLKSASRVRTVACWRQKA